MRAFRATYAYNYVQNGWLGDIFHIRKDNYVYMKAVVSPSQPGTGKIDYEAWVCLDLSTSTVSVSTGNCTCPAGNGHACSHISAILYAVVMAWNHGLAGQSCTDLPVAWGKGNAYENTQERIADIDFTRPSKNKCPTIVHEQHKNVNHPRMRFKKYETHAELCSAVVESELAALWMNSDTILNKLITAPELTPAPPPITMSHSNHDLDYSSGVPDIECQPCREFYEKYVALSPEHREALAGKTLEQKNDLWVTSRKLRLTASLTNSVPKTTRADPSKFINTHLYPRFKGNAATKQGNRNEPLARQKFEALTGTKVKCTGTVVSSTEPYLSASPDGLIDDDTILEIKCPTMSPREMAESGKYDIVADNSGHYYLSPKGKNGYYYQVQMTMFCTGTKCCKFFVWDHNKDDHILVSVPYDADFVESVIPRFRAFYFKNMLIRLVDDSQENRFKISDSYKNLLRP